MNVGELKALIANLPDDALVVTGTPHNAVIEAEAKVGTAREPNSMGFTDFVDELRYDEPAVFIYAPMV